MVSRVPLTGRSLFMHLKRAWHERGRQPFPSTREGEIENSRRESTTLFSGANETGRERERQNPSLFERRLRNDRSIPRRCRR